MRILEFLDLCIIYNIDFARICIIKPKCIINLQLHNRGSIILDKHCDNAIRDNEISYN